MRCRIFFNHETHQTHETNCRERTSETRKMTMPDTDAPDASRLTQERKLSLCNFHPFPHTHRVREIKTTRKPFN